MAGSIDRVAEAARQAGIEIEILRMGASTRTAAEAAAECGCTVGQIVKSLIFQGKTSGELYLFLLAGSSQLDLSKSAAAAGEELQRAEPRLIRDRTGFAIGGVSPIGHLVPIAAFADENLLGHERVWAAAGAHDAVFAAEPHDLVEAAKARICAIAA